jgi:hypothetical protein
MKSRRRSFSKKGGNSSSITGINDTSLYNATLISGDNVEKSDATCVPPPFGLNPCGPPVTPATLNERQQELLATIQKDNQSGVTASKSHASDSSATAVDPGFVAFTGGTKSSKKGGKRKSGKHSRRKTRRTRRALRKALKHHKKSMKHHKKSMKHHKKSKSKK